jgi:hypothetical protein
MIPWISLVFFVISHFEFLIFSDLGFFPPHFSKIWQGSANLVYYFKEPAFCFIDSLYGFLFSISLILALIYYYFSPSA